MALGFLGGTPNVIGAQGTTPGIATNLRVSQQGDSTNNQQSPTNNILTLTWTPGSAGSAGATTSQQVWRGANKAAKTFYATVAAGATTYTDNAATGLYYANNINEQTGAPGTHDNGTGPTTAYDYDIYGVNAAGLSSPTADCQFWFYKDGTLYAYNSGADLSGPNTCDYADTTLSPPTGSADMAITLAGANGFLQAPSYAPGTYVYGMEGGGFTYLYFTLKPTVASTQFLLSFHSRGTVGDIGQPFITLDISSYGPTPTSGVWATYKVPLNDLGFGTATFTGSITGGVMTASGWSGCPMDSGGWITWSGQTTPTQIQSTPSQTGNGTYGVAGTTSQGSIAMTYTRSNFYKINIKRQGGSNGEKFGVTNVYMARI